MRGSVPVGVYVSKSAASHTRRSKERRENVRLPREPGEPIRIAGEGVRKDLQRDLAAQLGVGGLPDLAHAALTKEGRDVVVPEASADVQGHALVYRVA